MPVIGGAFDTLDESNPTALMVVNIALRRRIEMQKAANARQAKEIARLQGKVEFQMRMNTEEFERHQRARRFYLAITLTYTSCAFLFGHMIGAS